MMSNYEPAEIVELGQAGELVLGAKPVQGDDGVDPEHEEIATLVDVDE